MLNRIFSRPRPMPRDVAEEVLSLCRSSQIDALGLSRHMRRDVGLDCGCGLPAALPPNPRGL